MDQVVRKMFQVDTLEDNLVLMSRVNDFIKNNKRPKFILGCNVYAKQVIKAVELDGVIDDFTENTRYNGLPVFKLNEVPKDSLVLVLSGGNTLSALKNVRDTGLCAIDYFSFYRYSGLDLQEPIFNQGFKFEYEMNIEKFNWIYSLLEDKESRKVFRKLVNFKYSYDIKWLEGFQNLENTQYFEDYLEYSRREEVFVDIGAFDGFTSKEFIKRCPQFKSVHVFEPDHLNLSLAKERLTSYERVYYYPLGLSDKREMLNFCTSGSCSTISKAGSHSIQVDSLDSILTDKITFIKMDIEGSETKAILGAAGLIRNNLPKLAISVYHKPEDFWKIPETIFSISDKYTIKLRHYTETLYETVMFFLPK